MKNIKKVIGFVTIMMLLSLQISADVFAVTSEDISVQEISKIEAPQTEETTSPTEESKAADDEMKSTDTTESVEGTQPPTSETGDDVKEEDSSKSTASDDDLMQNKEIDLAKGAVVINEKTITQGEESWEIFHENKQIVLTGVGTASTSVTTDHYTGLITLKNATIPNSMKLTGESVVALVLEGKNEIKATGTNTGLQVAAGNTVLITGDDNGSLTAVGASKGAGIGGINNTSSFKDKSLAGGNISIQSGTVTAIGTDGGAGIGGANHSDGGDITIGGTAVVEAQSNGDNGGAGIGSGTGSHKISGDEKGPGSYNGGNITIKDSAQVTAIGGGNAAGIGGGFCSDSGEILITGGTVDATGNGLNSIHHGGAGIGGGYEGHGKVTINGGKITAKASGANNSAAGIGSGASPNSNDKRGTDKVRGPGATHLSTEVTISSGDITAAGGIDGGAGIGGGGGADKVDILISGGTINATGAASDRSMKLGGAGIGSGVSFVSNDNSYSSNTELTVKVTGGDITSTGGWGASGIGSGADNIRANTVYIDTAANITAFADGTKFAVDTLKREKTPEDQTADVATWSGSNVLQGTFVGTDNSVMYEGLEVSLYEDDSSASEPDKIAYGELVKTKNLPGGYRSFATTVKSNSGYLLKSGDKWFGLDSKEKSEARGLENQGFTPHYKTGSDVISDNYWLYPGKNEATESNLGQVNVTKKVTENGLTKVVNQTFYLGIFTDEGLKSLTKLKDGEKAVVPITLNGTSEATVQNVQLPEGDYYAAEVNSDGTVIESTDNHKVTVKVNGEAASKLTIKKAEAANVEITNAYTQVNVEQPYQDGSFKATKNVTLNDQPNQVTETYYVGIFDDAFFTKPTTNTDGQKIMVPISLQNASTASVDNINIPIGTFYATEVNSNGTPVASTSELNVAVSVDGTQTNRLTVTGQNKPHVEITNAYTQVENPYKEGQFSVTKHVTLNGEDFGMKDTFYLGVFNNSDFTDVTINSDDEKLIVPIDLNGDVEATIENIDIPIGTFYVTEVTKNGKPIESNEGLQVTVTVDGTETSQLIIAEDGAAPHVTITNAYIDDTPQYYWTGTINVTKKVLENGKAHKMDQAKYYAGVFTDKNYSSLLTDDNDQPVIVTLNLKDSSKASASVDVPVGAEGAATTYYVAEVTKDGEVITKNSGMKFTPVIKGGTATVSGTKEANVTIENHYGKNAPATDNTSDKSPDKQSKANAVQTGDESRTMPFIILALAAALIAAVVIRRKRI